MRLGSVQVGIAAVLITTTGAAQSASSCIRVSPALACALADSTGVPRPGHSARVASASYSPARDQFSVQTLDRHLHLLAHRPGRAPGTPLLHVTWLLETKGAADRIDSLAPLFVDIVESDSLSLRFDRPARGRTGGLLAGRGLALSIGIAPGTLGALVRATRVRFRIGEFAQQLTDMQLDHFRLVYRAALCTTVEDSPDAGA